MKILVVEEDWGPRAAIEAMLDQAGHNVDIAASGEEGVEKLAAGQFDLAIIDVRMRGLSGQQVAQKARESHPDLRIIACTGGDMTRTPDWADAFLLKPFKFDGLKTAINEAMSRQR